MAGSIGFMRCDACDRPHGAGEAHRTPAEDGSGYVSANAEMGT